MLRRLLLGLLVTAWAGIWVRADEAAANPDFGIAANRILERTRVLASDEFEGRAPGTVGEDKTVAFLIREFQAMGLSPGNLDGTFVQPARLIGITSKPLLDIDVPGERIPLFNFNDFVGPTAREQERIEVNDSELIFAGYGVVAPEFGWDDFKDVDVRGKTLVVLVNDPPVPEGSTGRLDPAVFGGAAMTYYGRWMYKYEIAAAKGAIACLIVHETEAAAYPFAVVTSSRARENVELRSADGGRGKLAMEGWLTLGATQRIFAAAGKDFAALKTAAARPDFRPVALGARASFVIQSELRPLDSRNVVAVLPGSDPILRDEYVVYSAHWDHLGRDPRLQGDQIYNGAYDNAAGVAMLLEIAQALRALPAAERPKRSVLFLAPTAEEKGMMGARYYVQNPLVPLARTVANLNIDGANQFGPTSDVEVIGHGATTIDDIAADVARRHGRELVGEFHPERGSYFRSDHFEFAKVGVPAFYAKSGRRFIGLPEGTGERWRSEFYARDYHQVTDEVKPDWTFEGAAHDARFLLEVGLAIANSPTRPEWRAGTQFKVRHAELQRDAAGR